MGEAVVPNTMYLTRFDISQYWSSDVSADSLPQKSSCPGDSKVHVLLVYPWKHKFIRCCSSTLTLTWFLTTFVLSNRWSSGMPISSQISFSWQRALFRHATDSAAINSLKLLRDRIENTLSINIYSNRSVITFINNINRSYYIIIRDANS